MAILIARAGTRVRDRPLGRGPAIIRVVPKRVPVCSPGGRLSRSPRVSGLSARPKLTDETGVMAACRGRMNDACVRVRATAIIKRGPLHTPRKHEMC